MFTINIDPIAFTFATVTIRWYGIMVSLAIVALLALTVRGTDRLGVPRDVFFSFFLWSVVGGLVGARLIHVIDHIANDWGYYSIHPEDIIGYIFGFAGLALYGAVIGAVLAILIYAKIKKVPYSNLIGVFDCLAIAAPVAQAIGRVGCIINGCCYGIPSSLPWAVIYTHPNSACSLLGKPLHPAQIYFLIWNLIVFAIVWHLQGKLKPQGSLFLLYLSLYSAGDFTIRFLRDNEIVWLGLQQGQLISLTILVFASTWFILGRHRANQTERNR
jgi:phosphatidylglycerol:prolipoprotein diacylglycerol transferase